jgi:hypothetical protein
MKNYQMTIIDVQDLEELLPLDNIDAWEPYIVEEKTVGTVSSLAKPQ